MGQKLTTFSYFMSSCTNRIEVFNDFFSLICSQPRDKQNRARDFFLFKYFLNNLLLTVLMEMCNQEFGIHFQIPGVINPVRICYDLLGSNQHCKKYPILSSHITVYSGQTNTVTGVAQYFYCTLAKQNKRH